MSAPTLDLERLVERALPAWRVRIGAELALGLDPARIVALAIDTGVALHCYALDVAGARVTLDAVSAGLGAAALDSPGCPPGPLCVVVIREAGRVVAWGRSVLDMGAPS